MKERYKPDKLNLNSDGIEVKLGCTEGLCRTQSRRKCISEIIISTFEGYLESSDLA